MSQHKHEPRRTLILERLQELRWTVIGFFLLVAVFVFLSALALVDRGQNLPSDHYLSDRDYLFAKISNFPRFSVELNLFTIARKQSNLSIGDPFALGLCGKVVASVDFSQVKRKDIEIIGRKVRIKLPPAKISSVEFISEDDMLEIPPYIVEGKTVEFHSMCDHNYENPRFSLDPQDTINDIKEGTLDAFKTAAEEYGICQMAQAEIEHQLENWLLLAGYESVEIMKAGE